MSEYVEFYGDHVFLVQMIPNIAQISIFTNFIKNHFLYFYIFVIFFKKRDVESSFGVPGACGRVPGAPRLRKMMQKLLKKSI